MTGIDLEKSQNYNEPGLTLHESKKTSRDSRKHW
ncbi:hypothetical protein T11_8446 [Trichinella zimbabwensis]|uniref:Uncharacterized protein n=1 Tax=Trichinella zimbabwensis TaxID=268475 RepID=A0A0V1GJ92_9BILA|nr:hypothetical protein T11_8446 [Trichinella zimbabwensis]